MDSTVESIAAYSQALRHGDLSSDTLHHARRCLVDTVGCLLGGYRSKPGQIARALALRAEVSNGARIIGTRKRALPELAAFANGVAARYLDANDLFPGGGGHPSNTIACILAAADLTRSDGKALLTAIVLAYEIYWSLYQSARPFDKGVDHAFNTAMAGAAAAAKLLGLDQSGIAQALSLAISPNVALYTVRFGHLSMWKGCSEPNGARNGVFAALLAAEGMTGPEKPLEGPHSLKKLLGEFEWLPMATGSQPHAITGVSIKYYSAVAHAQPVITTALPLSKRVELSDIEHVTMHTYHFAWEVTGREREKWRPATREAADHSLPYVLAAVLADRNFSEATFSDERLRDPRIRELIDKVEIVEDPELTRRFPQSMPCRIEVRTKSGKTVVEASENPRGHFRNPMSDGEIEAKFRANAKQVLPADQIASALTVLWQIDNAASLEGIYEAVTFE